MHEELLHELVHNNLRLPERGFNKRGYVIQCMGCEVEKPYHVIEIAFVAQHYLHYRNPPASHSRQGASVTKTSCFKHWFDL